MEAKDSARIAHILEAAQDIKNFIQGRDRSSLDNEKMLLYAIVRAIEIIGEALKYPQKPDRNTQICPGATQLVCVINSYTLTLPSTQISSGERRPLPFRTL